jgi:hypothetical protein
VTLLQSIIQILDFKDGFVISVPAHDFQLYTCFLFSILTHPRSAVIHGNFNCKGSHILSQPNRHSVSLNTSTMPANHNEALKDNPFVVNDRTVDIHITVDGSDWYYAAMSVMGLTMLIIIGASLRRPRTHRVFHHILAAAAMTGMIEHYSMASNLGWVPIDVEWQRSNPLVAGVNRQIWWVRYCGW